MNSASLQPLYFLVGEEVFQKKEFLDQIRSELFPPHPGYSACEYMLGGEDSPAAILDAARTPALDLFASAVPSRIRKLVVVDRAENISPADWKILADYFADPLDDVCLVFLVYQKPSAWTRGRNMPSRAVKIFYPLRGRKLEGWLDRKSRHHGLRLSVPAREELLRTAGEDPYVLEGELEKLLLFRGTEGVVQPEEVREVAGAAREANIFGLSTDILTGNVGAALVCLRQLIEAGQRPLRILSILVGDIRKVWLGREVWEKSHNLPAACRAAGVRFYREEFAEKIKNFPLRILPAVYRRLLEADLDVKSGGMGAKIALERLVIDLIRLRREENPGGPAGSPLFRGGRSG